MSSAWPGFLPVCPQTVHALACGPLTRIWNGILLSLVKHWGIGLLLLGWVAGARALPPSDFFEPDLAMYSFADLYFVRPMSIAVLPLTVTTFAASLPFTAGAGKESAARSYDILVSDPTQFLAARPLGSFFDWENRDKTRPVVIRFPDGYTVAELSPQQERRYRVALKEHQERILAIERETELPEGDRQLLAAAENRRWENVLRLLLSL